MINLVCNESGYVKFENIKPGRYFRYKEHLYLKLHHEVEINKFNTNAIVFNEVFGNIVKFKGSDLVVPVSIEEIQYKVEE